MFDKKVFFEKVVKHFRQKIATTQEILDGMNHTISTAPGAMESHSDTTKFQTSIVAGEQARSLQNKSVALDDLMLFLSGGKIGPSDVIEIGSTFRLRDGKNMLHFVVLPNGGGENVEFEGNEYCTITPNSLLFRNIAGKGKGEMVSLGQGQKTRLAVIEDVV